MLRLQPQLASPSACARSSCHGLAPAPLRMRRAASSIKHPAPLSRQHLAARPSAMRAGSGSVAAFWEVDQNQNGASHQSKLEQRWLDNLQLLQEFVAQHGRLPKTTEGKVGSWAGAQRTANRKGTLTPERMAALETVPGWTWGKPVHNQASKQVQQTAGQGQASRQVEDRQVEYGQASRREEYGQLGFSQQEEYGQLGFSQQEEYGQLGFSQQEEYGQLGFSQQEEYGQLGFSQQVEYGQPKESDFEENWFSYFNQLRQHAAQHDRLPSESEGTLGLFVKDQAAACQAYLEGKSDCRGMTAERLALLRTMPDWPC